MMLRRLVVEEAVTWHTLADVSAGPGAAMAVKRARHQAGPAVMSAQNGGSWATGPATAAPSPRKSRPTSSRMRRRPRSFSLSQK